MHILIIITIVRNSMFIMAIYPILQDQWLQNDSCERRVMIGNC